VNPIEASFMYGEMTVFAFGNGASFVVTEPVFALESLIA